jgi:benzodiazapine receptor
MSKQLIIKILVVVSTIFALSSNILAITLPLNNRTTQAISDTYPILFTPANYVFSIWGIIYIGLIAFSLFQLFAKSHHGEVGNRVRVAFILSNLANGLWIVWWHYDQLILSAVTMLVLLGSLIYLYSQLPAWKTKQHPLYRLCITLPISIYLGWISVATIANISVLLYALGWDGLRISGDYWAGFLCLIAADLAVNFLWVRRDYPFAAVIVWALIGILVKQGSAQPLAILATVSLALVLFMTVGLLLISSRKWLIAYRARRGIKPPAENNTSAIVSDTTTNVAPEA